MRTFSARFIADANERKGVVRKFFAVFISESIRKIMLPHSLFSPGIDGYSNGAEQRKFVVDENIFPVVFQHKSNIPRKQRLIVFEVKAILTARVPAFYFLCMAQMGFLPGYSSEAHV